MDPSWFIAEQIPQAKPPVVTENSVVVAWQLGNLYLLLAFLGLFILNTTSEAKVVRSYLWALWLGDIGHVLFSGYGLGLTRLMSPHEWNAMAWGNIAVTVSAPSNTITPLLDRHSGGADPVGSPVCNSICVLPGPLRSRQGYHWYQ